MQVLLVAFLLADVIDVCCSNAHHLSFLFFFLCACFRFNWFTRIVPSLRTWAPAFKHLFIVLPHNAEALRFLKQQNCASTPQPLGKGRSVKSQEEASAWSCWRVRGSLTLVPRSYAQAPAKQ